MSLAIPWLRRPRPSSRLCRSVGPVPITVHKLHGLGNEFLVVLPGDADRLEHTALPRIAVSLCDPATGPGADGLIVGEWDGADLRMILHNADGSRAEMSGNGIRCLVHAVHRDLLDRGESLDRCRVRTDAGLRTVAVVSCSGEEVVSSVEMGTVADIDAPEGWETLGCHPDRPVAHLSLGNPHSVVGVDDVAEVDLASLGAKVPHVNLEIVAPDVGSGAVRMRVHERGVGITAACGTGACAAAVAARRWGLVPASSRAVTVRMDGGSVTVEESDTGEVTLVGPSVYVGCHEVGP